MSLVKTNAILDASGGTTASINGYTPTVSNMAGSNRIINGAMMIDQRNAGASVTANNVGAYCLDRYQLNFSQNSKFTVQQNAGSVTPPIGFTNYLGITSSSAYSVLSSDYFTVEQPIEGYNVSDFGWGTANAQSVTMSFRVYSSLTGTFAGVLSNSSQNRSYPFTYTVSSANTWTTVTLTIPGDTTGTWLKNNGIGIRVRFGLGAGSTYSGTAGSWASANYFSATGAVSVVGTSGSTFYITGVQLEAGSVATPFDFRQYGQELALCQRYFYLFGPAPSAGSGLSGALLVNPILGQQARLALPLVPVEMRTVPTPLFYTTGAASGSLTEFSSATTFSVSSTSGVSVSGGGWAQLGASLTYGVHFRATYSAEL